jgi:hypothetical protein
MIRLNCISGELLDRIQNTGVMGRIGIYLVALYVGVTSMLPESDIGRMFDTAGHFGDLVGWLLVGTSFLGVADSVINDLMTDKYVVRFGLMYRHYLLMSVAAAYGTAMFIAYGAPRGGWVQPFFLIQAMLTCAAALFDIRRRFKK